MLSELVVADWKDVEDVVDRTDEVLCFVAADDVDEGADTEVLLLEVHCTPKIAKRWLNL
jgi:hypothetical protein